MQGQTPLWPVTTTLRDAAAPVLPVSPVPAPKPSRKALLRPVFTGMFLTAGTLGAAAAFTAMLPVTGKPARAPMTVAAPAPIVTSLTPVAPAPTAPVAPAIDADPLLPRVLLSVAAAAAEALAKVELSLDAQSAIAADVATAVNNAFPTPPAIITPTLATAAAPARPETATPAPVASASKAPTLPADGPSGERVVYLVDASGSLLDSLPRVIDWLGESLDDLGKQQRFTVLFFRQGEVIEAPPTGMKHASFAAKANVFTWMQPEAGNVNPQGKSDVAAALKAALGYDATDVVILSDDSFARRAGASGDDARVLTEIARTVNASGSTGNVRIHTVQFFYRDEAGALEAIADCFHGTYRFVQPTPRDTTANVDPLLDLAL